MILGEFSFQFSDLISPQGHTPKFAQVYTLMPDDALKLRENNISDTIRQTVKREILSRIETLMRQNPYGITFKTTWDKVNAARAQNNGEIPHFQIVLLSDRDLKTDAFKNRSDVTIIERADAPTAKQVAVIWVQEDGLAPEVNGLFYLKI